jgi:hypothetical protein
MSGGFWAFFWLMVVMKIPLLGALAIIWYALKAPEPEADRADGDGGSFRDHGPRIRPPHPPRRGPHGDPAPRSPARVRTAHAPRRVPAGHA